MTRDQFIYGLTACGCLLKDGKTWYEHNELIKCFEDLGLFEQEPTTEWIPVGDELPKEEGHYLTTNMFHEVYCDYWNGERFERTETIIAWQPLPEPYREVEE